MKQQLRQLTAAAVLALGLSGAHAGILPGPVVDTQWLAANMDKVQVIEVRDNVKTAITAPEFETDAKTGKKTLTDIGGHIPGSLMFEMKSMRVDRQIGDIKVKYMIPAKADWEKIVQSAGVKTGKPIVLVPLGLDFVDVDNALRVYWQFKVYGEDDMAVLDGGMSTWLNEGRAFEVSAPATGNGTWVSKADRSAQYFATTEDVSKAMADKSAQLVDSRDARNFLGLAKRDYVYAYGHLDGAKLVSPDMLLKPAGGSQKLYGANTYQAIFSAQGLDASKPVITYCNSGHLSAGPWFVASEILGNKSAKLYDGSLHEWTLEKHSLVGAVPLQ